MTASVSDLAQKKTQILQNIIKKLDYYRHERTKGWVMIGLGVLPTLGTLGALSAATNTGGDKSHTKTAMTALMVCGFPAIILMAGGIARVTDSNNQIRKLQKQKIQFSLSLRPEKLAIGAGLAFAF